MFKKIFDRNNLAFGVLISLITPVILYFLFYYFIEYLSLKINYGIALIDAINIQTTVIFLNLFIYYKYLLGKDYEKTGRGVILVTFVLGVAHFIIRWTLM